MYYWNTLKNNGTYKYKLPGFQTDEYDSSVDRELNKIW